MVHNPQSENHTFIHHPLPQQYTSKNNYALLLLSVEADDDGPISRRQIIAAENDTVATAHAVAYFFHHGDLRTAIIISLFRSINSAHDLTIVLYPTGGSGDDHE